MKQISLLLLSFFLCAILQAETTPASSYAGGSGTSTDPYQIATLAQLRLLSETSGDWDKYFILNADIDASDTKTWNYSRGFSRIGTPTTAFTGVFDGNRHTIDSLHIKNASYYTGMFGYANGAIIKNLGLTNCAMSLTDIGGGLAGRITNSTVIEKCYVTGTVSASTVNRLGGLVGVMTNSTIKSCYTNCVVKTQFGGTNVGGIVGLADGTSSIENCFVADSCKTHNDNGYGGIVGQMQSSDMTIANCYVSGVIKNVSSVITGIYMGTIENCYYDKTINPGSCSHATGLTSSDFSYATAFPGWDFQSTWKVLALAKVDSIMRPNLQWSYDHIVTFESDKNKGTIIGANIQGIDHNSSALKVTASPGTGYYFDEWQNAAGDSISADNSLTIESVTRDSTLKAVFKPFIYTVTFSADENSTLTGNTTQTLAYSSNATEILATSVTAGYGFVEWQDASGNSVSTNNPLILNVTKDLSLKAVFAKKYEDGIGSTDNPYQIATLEQLKSLSETTGDWTRSFILTADIDASNTKTWNSGVGFSPIGDVVNTGYRQQVPFTGVFDGKNHIISNLYINREEQLLGLFGRIEAGSEIKNIGLVNAHITGATNVVGNVGALIGYAQGNNGKIKVSNCFATGGYINGYNALGGLIGTVSNVTITNCYATINVSGYSRVGGLAGRLGVASFINCYAAGKCTGTEYVKGFYGSNEATPSITSCYWDSITSGMPDECYKITPVSTTKFSDESTFSGWDFSSVYKILALSSADSVKRPHFEWAYDHVVTFELGENGDTIIGANVQGVKNDSSALKVIAVAKAGYQFKNWQDKNGNILSTDNPFVLTNVTSDITIYAAFDKYTSVPHHDQSEIAIYPNPATDRVYINGADKTTISVCSITGKQVYYNSSFTGGTIDLSELENGIYIIKLNSNGKTSIKKLIKK